MIRIRVFKATNEPESCLKYAEGHLQVLKEFDLAVIIPANLDWINDPYTYVIVAESVATGKMLGGAQVQLCGSKRPLPIELAIKEIDERIHDTVKQYGITQTGELFGFWNSKEIAGYGIGSFYLTIAAIAIAPKLKIKTLFALCSPYTTELYNRFGFIVTTFLGNNGTFFYPKKDFTAVSMIMLDCDAIETAGQTEKQLINALREQPQQTIAVEGQRKAYEIQFDLEIRSSFTPRS